MVFFNCNACGETMKKNQVENHYQFKCRNCTVLSCVDCQKDFPGDSYKEHLKCISEEEKYSAKGFKPKANKGEQKQEAWTEQVVSAIERCKSNSKLRDLLIRIKDYPNIPRKRAKFENFLKNCAGVWATNLIGEAWDVINTAAQSKAEEKKENEEEEQSNDTAEAELTDPHDKKLSKRDRKEERRKKQQKVQKKHKGQVENGEHSEKKAKKRKLKDIEEEEDSEKKPKKKEKRTEEKEESCEEADAEEAEESEEPEKFRWGPVVLSLLEKAKDNEMPLKRLKKKVLSEFHARGGDGSTFTEEKLMRKFNKTVLKNPKFKVHKEKVKLRH